MILKNQKLQPIITKKWEEDFNNRIYLEEYYSHIGSENEALLEFLANSYKKIPQNKIILDFGGGPTIYQLIAAASRTKEIHYSDFLENNRKEIKKWIKNNPESFNWSNFTRRILELEGNKNISEKDILDRENETKNKIKKIISCDAKKDNPIELNKKYDVISVQFVAESITDSRKEWEKYMKNILNILKPGGFLIMSTIKGAQCYKVGNKYFPSVNIDEDDVKKLLIKNNFDHLNIQITNTYAEHSKSQKYQGLIFVFGRKNIK